LGFFGFIADLVSEEIKKKIELIPQANNLHHIHIWQIDEKRILFESHIT